MSGETDGRLLLLDESDKVLVAISRLRAGETILLEGASIAVSADLPIGHKLARRAISAGEKIVKYGATLDRVGDREYHQSVGAACPRPERQERIYCDLPSGRGQVRKMEA